MKKISCFFMLLLLFGWRPVLAMTTLDPAGVIKSVVGGVTIIGKAGAIAAVENMKVHSGAVMTTDNKAYVGIIFEDDTVISMGPDSRFCLDDFKFDPALEELSFVGRMLNGTFSYLSGQIGKQAPQRVKLQTPVATLGVRGTKILVKVE